MEVTFVFHSFPGDGWAHSHDCYARKCGSHSRGIPKGAKNVKRFKSMRKTQGVKKTPLCIPKGAKNVKRFKTMRKTQGVKKTPLCMLVLTEKIRPTNRPKPKA